MILDPNRLEDPRIHEGVMIARCPVCAKAGQDRNSDFLGILDRGYRCKADPQGKGSEHSKLIYKLAGVRPTAVAVRYQQFLNQQLNQPLIVRPPARFGQLAIDDLKTIQKEHRWPSNAALGLLQLAARGLLFHAEVYDGGHRWDSWVITDRSQINAQALRIDDECWTDTRDPLTLPGFDPHWPIGAANIGHLPMVAIAVGQENFAALPAIAAREGVPFSEIAPVCMTEVGMDIPASALAFFARKRVRIFVGSDEEGLKAFQRWSQQLRKVNAEVDGHSFGDLQLPNGDLVTGPSDYLEFLGSKSPKSSAIFADLFPSGDDDEPEAD